MSRPAASLPPVTGFDTVRTIESSPHDGLGLIQVAETRSPWRAARPVDALAGLLFAGIGAGALLIARHYPFGTAAQPGAGFFPFSLGALLALAGLVILLRALLPGASGAEPLPRPAWRALILIPASVVAFALLLDTVGLALAGTLLVFGCRLAGRDFRALETLLLALVLVGGATFAFGYGLAIPFKLWPV